MKYEVIERRPGIFWVRIYQKSWFGWGWRYILVYPFGPVEFLTVGEAIYSAKKRIVHLRHSPTVVWKGEM